MTHPMLHTVAIPVAETLSTPGPLVYVSHLLWNLKQYILLQNTTEKSSKREELYKYSTIAPCEGVSSQFWTQGVKKLDFWTYSATLDGEDTSNLEDDV